MTLFILVGMLTLFALRDDSPMASSGARLKNTETEAITHAEHHQESVEKAEGACETCLPDAMTGTPVEGGHMLMRTDPKTAGRKLFETRCGSCHNFSAQNPFPKDDSAQRFLRKAGFQGQGRQPHRTAGDLGDFGTEAWVRSLLKNPMDSKHFGNVMVDKKDDDGKVIKARMTRRSRCTPLEGMKGWREEIDKLPPPTSPSGKRSSTARQVSRRASKAARQTATRKFSTPGKPLSSTTPTSIDVRVAIRLKRKR